MKKIVYLILALLLCIPLTGCGGKLNESLLKSDSVPLIIIAGKHANMNFFTEIPETLSKLINDSMTVSDTGNGYQCKADVSIIINDGAPATLDLNFDLTETTNEYNENYLNANVESIKNNIQRVLLSNKVIADDEESDLLTALHEASFIARMFSNIFDKVLSCIIVYILLKKVHFFNKYLHIENIHETKEQE